LSRSCVIDAPCKINLHLEVGGLRPDGYHDLRSVFLCLGFADTLKIEEIDGAAFRGVSERPGGCGLETAGLSLPDSGSTAAELLELPPERNIVTKAAAVFREQTGYDKPLAIRLEKRIPPGGGLGGGSSDAASVLLALDALAGTALDREALVRMAEKLGSDVPFFLYGGAALVTGRGERIQPLEVSIPFWVALVNPGFSSPTGAAFAKLDAFRAKTRRGLESGPAAGVLDGFSGDGLFSGKGAGTRRIPWPYRNDFLPALREDAETGEAYSRLLADLETLGADFAGLSGAGSTCFGIFFEGGAAERALGTLLERWNFVKLTFFLARFGKPVLQ
jgi:4-diphosphocytidyl-2-C-methyl-D-erythritol kinase